ncbi:MAG: porin [Pseudomonadota bacterium]
MKRILLASTAIVAFAGAAAAEVSFEGDSEFGWNDEFDDGFFWSVGATLLFSMELDNGLTASVSGDVEFVNSPEDDEEANGNSTFDGNEIEIDDLVLGIENDFASLMFGDTAPAADSFWSSPVTNLDADDFNDEDDLDDEDGVIIGRVTFGQTEVGLSYAVVDSNDTDDSTINDGSIDDLIGLQLGATTTVAGVDLLFAYQEAVDGLESDIETTDIPDTPEIYAFGASTELAGFDLGFAFAYANDDDSDTDEELTSVGLQGATTIGDITVTVFYVFQDAESDVLDDDVDDNYGIELDYAPSSMPLTASFRFHDGQDEETAVDVTYEAFGIAFFAGYLDEGETGAGVDGSSYYYLGGDYDLGGGANVRVSYADIDREDGDDLTRDELGAAEDVKEGFSLILSFVF